MRIIFMGTPDFAKQALQDLYNAGHEIMAVVTNTDKPKGRGMKVIASPVKQFALENNLNVIYCVGETLRDKENGSTFEILEKQISEVLNNVEIKNIMIAYEPVWAIGTGNVPSIKEIKENIEFISDLLYEKYECKLDILYGGSVNDENIGELCSIKGLCGFLVGGASLDVNKVKGMILEMEK